MALMLRQAPLSLLQNIHNRRLVAVYHHKVASVLKLSCQWAGPRNFANFQRIIMIRAKVSSGLVTLKLRVPVSQLCSGSAALTTRRLSVPE